MSAPVTEPSQPLPLADVPVLDVVIPVHNEEVALAASVERVHRHLSGLPYSFRITIADNASVDGTAFVAHRLSHEYDEVQAVYQPGKGPGSRAEARVVHVGGRRPGLHGRRPLHGPQRAAAAGRTAAVRPLRPGDRVAADAGIAHARGPKRELISRGYNLLLRGTLRARFSDAQCGFKGDPR